MSDPQPPPDRYDRSTWRTISVETIGCRRLDGSRRLIENAPLNGTTDVAGTSPIVRSRSSWRSEIVIGPAGQNPYAVPQPRPPTVTCLPAHTGSPPTTTVRCAWAIDGTPTAIASITARVRPICRNCN